MVGRLRTVGNLVNHNTIGAIFSAEIKTYPPFFIVSDAANPDPSADVIIRGIDYQETLTNFPFGSQVVTGVFLNISEAGLEQATEKYEYTLADRIGTDARLSGQTPPIPIDP